MSQFQHRAGRVVTGCFLLGCLALPAAAGDITLLWDASADATGYRAYWGTTSGNYTQNQDAGNSLQTSISTLQNCRNYFFAVTARNAAGESGFSQEIQSWPRPVVSQSSPATGEQGDSLDVVITGTNYQQGAGVRFGGSGITVNSVTRNACGQLTVNISIANNAPTSSRTVFVTNPNGVEGTAAGLFSVTAPSQSPPDPPTGLNAQ